MNVYLHSCVALLVTDAIEGKGLSPDEKEPSIRLNLALLMGALRLSTLRGCSSHDSIHKGHILLATNKIVGNYPYRLV